MHRIAFLALCSMMTAAAADVGGKWNVTAQTGGRDVKVEMELKDAGGKLTGSMSTPQGTVELTEIKLSGNELTFKIPTGDATYTIKMNVNGDSMKGTWTAEGGDSGPMTAARAGATAAVASNGAITGKWKATAITPGGEEMKVVIDVTESAGKLGGTLTTANGDQVELSDVKFENNDFTCAIQTGDGTYRIKMTLTGDTLKGSYTDPGGQTGKVSAIK